MKLLSNLISLLVFGLSVVTCSALTLNTTAVKDNSLYEEGALSNGAGDFLFAGRTTGNAGPTANRRALLEFDVSSIPSNAVINGVTFFIEVDRRPPGTIGADDFSLHRLTQDWGEGSSDAPGAEGGGTAAAPGDATWVNNFEGISPWLALGGDFDPLASATQAIADPGSYSFSGAGLIADVQSWVNGDSPNHGWILVAGESSLGTVRRFISRNDIDQAPRIFVDYQTVPEPSGMVLILVGALLLRKRFLI